ncbi:hypothetical protein HUJ05_002118 [Dendroctonus ponderosae]|nr:hypothetical protein HUJ05_002118 [Dendroctonus ponderosae]
MVAIQETHCETEQELQKGEKIPGYEFLGATYHHRVKQLTFDKSRDMIIGYVDLGHLGRVNKSANHALIFMVYGLHKNWKQPAAVFFTRGTVESKPLQSLVKDIIIALEAAGLVVLATKNELDKLEITGMAIEFDEGDKNTSAYLPQFFSHFLALVPMMNLGARSMVFIPLRYDYLTSDKKIRLLTVQRKRFKEELLIGAPPGSIVTISDTGHINSELFVRWLNYFIETVKPSPEATVLLLLDGHSTHSKNLRALRIARENGISASTSYQESQQEASSSEEDNLTLAQIASRTKRAEPTSQNVSVHEISPLPISKSQSSKISRNQDAVELTITCGIQQVFEKWSKLGNLTLPVLPSKLPVIDDQPVVAQSGSKF